MVTEAVSDRAILELKIDFERGADANQAGNILTRLASAYSKHCRSQGMPYARLVIDRVEIASLFAVLEGVVDMVKGAKTLFANRELIESFTHEIAASIMTIESASPGIVPPYMRSLVRALIAPLSKGTASRTTIRMTNAAGASIEIDTAEAAVIEQAFKLTHEVILDDEHRITLAQKHPLLSSYRTGSALADHATLGNPNRGLGKAELQGTLVHSLGVWYVRPATLNGVMLPAIFASLIAEPDTAGTYVVSGYLQPVNAIPNKFEVEMINHRLS